MPSIDVIIGGKKVGEVYGGFTTAVTRTQIPWYSRCLLAPAGQQVTTHGSESSAIASCKQTALKWLEDSRRTLVEHQKERKRSG